jgi:hypothetical protein
MGRLTNLNPPAPIADEDLPSTIARDGEVKNVMDGHLAAIHPHLQYLLQAEGMFAIDKARSPRLSPLRSKVLG